MTPEQAMLGAVALVLGALVVGQAVGIVLFLWFHRHPRSQ